VHVCGHAGRWVLPCVCEQLIHVKYLLLPTLKGKFDHLDTQLGCTCA
jgi:hypothetical protein